MENKRYKDQAEKPEFEEVVVEIKRTSKKTKGGDRLGFTCLAVIGDKNGRVGMALSRATSVLPAIKKSTRRARKKLIVVPIVGDERTIPHSVEVKNGASHILLKPAPAGTGIRAGGAVRSVLEVAGINNVVGKVLGTNSKKGNVDTVLMALAKLREDNQRVVKFKKSKKKS